MSAVISTEPDGTAGFTLLEVLVALAVLAVSVTSIGSLVAANMRGTRALDAHLALISAARAIEAGLPGPTQAISSPLTGRIDGHAWRVDYRPFFGGSVPVRRSAPWVPQTVTITVVGPTGARFQLETIQLRRRSAS